MNRFFGGLSSTGIKLQVIGTDCNVSFVTLLWNAKHGFLERPQPARSSHSNLETQTPRIWNPEAPPPTPRSGARSNKCEKILTFTQPETLITSGTTLSSEKNQNICLRTAIFWLKAST
jgi:hypothetical protein